MSMLLHKFGDNPLPSIPQSQPYHGLTTFTSGWWRRQHSISSVYILFCTKAFFRTDKILTNNLVIYSWPSSVAVTCPTISCTAFRTMPRVQCWTRVRFQKGHFNLYITKDRFLSSDHWNYLNRKFEEFVYCEKKKNAGSKESHRDL